MTHTAEPWIGMQNGKYNSDHDLDCTNEQSSVSTWAPIYANGKVIALVVSTEYSFDELDANARRIVACVNACKGIPIDLLEVMPSGPASLLPMYAKLEQQRDELLEALHIALPFVEDAEDAEDDECYKPGAVSKALKTIRAAISKATT